MKKLVLASASPSRRQILETLGVDFEICPSNYEEDMSLPLKPKALAIHLSQGKAREVVKKYSNAVIVAADSFAVYKGNLLGKPHTNKKAREMLAMLNGRAHSFITGFTIIDTDSKQEISGVVESKVYLRKLTNEEIDNYIAKENILEKAGAYSIQDLGMLLIDKVDGDYSNIRGLPIGIIAQHLKKFGLNLL